MGSQSLIENQSEQLVHPCVRSSGNAPQQSPDISHFQRDVGNHAIQSLFRSGAIRAKLAISMPDDPAETEAENVAQNIMRSHAGLLPSTCSCGQGGEMCGECQRKHSSRDIHRSASATTASSPANQTGPQVLRSSGHPLDPSTRAFFEPRFGRDFGHIRVHDGPEAASSARSIQAHAYTAGSDLVFASNQYSPDSTAGRSLIAHELTHVIQSENAAQLHAVDSGTIIFRQIAGTPDGPDPCLDLLQAIIHFLNEVAKRFNDALNDKHDLYKYHRSVQDADPENGSWDGHRSKFYEDREQLRYKRALWDINDDCRGFQLTEEQAKDLEEAVEFGNKEFPAKPANAMYESNQPTSESVWDKLRKYLPEALVVVLLGIGAYLAAAAIVGCFASGACEIAAALAGLGFVTAAAIGLILRSSGVKDQPGDGPVASSDQKNDEQNQTA